MKLSVRLLLFLLVALIALPAHAKNPRWGKVVNVQIQGRPTSRQPEAPANPSVALPLAANRRGKFGVKTVNRHLRIEHGRHSGWAGIDPEL